MRTVLKYPGSKWNIAGQLVNLIPEHHSYVEPFFGSGAVLFNKPESDIETINDLDHDVVNLFRCIQDDSERLARMVMTTPFSREKYEDTYKLDVWELMMPDEPYHKALRFLIQCWQGHGFRTNGYKDGWKNDVVGRERAYALWNWYRLPDWIIDIAERLRKVQIENRPAMEVIKRFNHSGVFMYIDPPYLLGTRTGKQYKHEMADSDHEELLRELLKSKAKIMISGYESDKGLDIAESIFECSNYEKDEVCQRCRAYQKRYRDKKRCDLLRSERADYGICYICGKNPIMKGKKVCEACYETRLKTLPAMWENMNNDYFRQLNYARYCMVNQRKEKTSGSDFNV